MFQFIQWNKVFKLIMNILQDKRVFIVSLYYDVNFTGANNRFKQLLNCSFNVDSVLFLSSVSSIHQNHFVLPRFKTRLLKLIFNQLLQLFLWNHYVIFDSPYLFRNKKHYLLVHDPAGIFPNLRRNTLYDVILFRFFLFSANNFVCVSEYTCSVLRRYYPLSKIIVSFNGADKCTFHVKHRDVDFLIITSGEKHKRDFQLISRLLESYPNVIVAVVTRSISLKEEFKDLINVRFYNNLSREEISDLHRRSKYYANFSRIEGFGMPIIDALSFGSKLLISNIPVYREILGLYNSAQMISDKVIFLNIVNNEVEIPNNLFLEENNLTNAYYIVNSPPTLKWDQILSNLLYQIKCNDEQ